ncbi:BON domain-containing protein [Micromonospora violae]|uniref:BON domain-containing protein n=1 Tax=Micromonospora violae TaxID=1278207 RepID=A0A4Q7UFP7_9ACTN|nr:BON domain-containing protein [Micromonospora violae]RZT79654.1 BON domain-containing protein [Micromonospora violae]
MTYVPWFLPDDPPPLFPTAPASIDARLALRLLELMQRDPQLRHERICIEVQNGVVILQGTVTCTDVSREANARAWSIPGVHDVNNRLCPLKG